MSIDLQNLQTTITSLNQIDNQHLEADSASGEVVKGTHSIGGRIASWFKSGTHAGAEANKAMLRNLIQQTGQNLGKEYADSLINSLHTKLDSGRPIKGRELAQAFQEVATIKASNDAKQAKIESTIAKQNFIDAKVNEYLNSGKIPKDQIPADFAKKISDRMENSENSRIANFGEGYTADAKNFQQTVEVAINNEAKDIGKNKLSDFMTELTKIDKSPDSIKNKITASLQEKNIKIDLPDNFMKSLQTKIIQNTENKTIQHPSGFKFPTMENCKNIVNNSIDDIVKSFEIINSDQNLKPSLKESLITTMLNNDFICTPQMTQAVVTMLPDALVTSQAITDPKSSPEDIRNAFDNLADSYNKATRELVTVNGTEVYKYKAGLDGEDNLTPVKLFSFKAALDSIGIIKSDDSKTQSLVTNTIKQTYSSSSSFVNVMKSIQDSPNQADISVKEQTKFFTMALAETIKESRDLKFINYFSNGEVKTSLLTFADAKERVGGAGLVPLPTYFNKQAMQNSMAEKLTVSKNVTVLDDHLETKMAIIQTIANLDAKQNPTDNDKKSLDLYQKKLDNIKNYERSPAFEIEKHFSNTFFKDIKRSFEVIINGQNYPAQGLNDEEWLANLQAMASNFPSLEVAGSVLGRLHQGYGADISLELLSNADTAPHMLGILSGSGDLITQKLSINVTTSPDDGNVKAEFTIAMQKEQGNGVMVKTDYNFSGFDQANPTIGVSNFEYLVVE